MKMGEKDLETLGICFNSAYYLVKQERPFSDYPNFITLQHKNDIKKCQSYMTDRAAAHTTAEGLKEAISSAFKRTGITEFHTKLAGFNVDGASVNTDIHKGLAQLLHESSPCLNVVHCFNHHFQLAIKDAFKVTFFEDSNTMLNKLHYLYRKSPKCFYENTVKLVRFMKSLCQNQQKPMEPVGFLINLPV